MSILQDLRVAHEELLVDAVGFFGIVSRARDAYGLSQEETIEFVRLYLNRLAKNGGVPVVGAIGRDDVDWIYKNYGETAEEWIEKIISEWLASGKDPGPGDVWFGNPEYISIGKI